MKCRNLFMILALCVSVSSSFAAEKNVTLIKLDGIRSTVEMAAGKTEGNKEAAADLERARNAIRYADESLKAGKSMFSSDINPETEKEVKLAIDMADVATATALSRVEFVRATGELEAIEKQFTSAKAKLKLFEDRKAELEQLRAEAIVCQKNNKELELIKSEKAAMMTQVEQLAVERSRADKLKIELLELTRSADETRAENVRLSAQLKKQSTETHSQPSFSPAGSQLSEDQKKQAPRKP